jgi:hypothetical protein
MLYQSLKEKLINKIKETEDLSILQDISNLFKLQEPASIYQINEKQKNSIEEARTQIKNQQTLSNEQANKEADEWLNE